MQNNGLLRLFGWFWAIILHTMGVQVYIYIYLFQVASWVPQARPKFGSLPELLQTCCCQTALRGGRALSYPEGSVTVSSCN